MAESFREEIARIVDPFGFVEGFGNQEVVLKKTDRILSLKVGKRDNGLTIGELIDVALEAQEPLKAIIIRARQRPPMVISDE